MVSNKADATEKSITEKLYFAFHGDPSNPNRIAFARAFSSMTGPFEAFMDKGFVSTVYENIIEAIPSPTKSQLRLDLSQLLLLNDSFEFSHTLGLRLMRASLKDKTDNVLSRRTLKRYLDDDLRGVRKITAMEKQFLDGNGCIPSGN